MEILEILKNTSLQSPGNIVKHLKDLKVIYLKNSSNIVFKLIKEWQKKLEYKLKH